MSSDRTDSARPLGEISQAPAALDQFLDRHQKTLVILGLLIALAAAAFLIHRGIRHSHERTAGDALSKATEPADLKAIVDAHPDTAAAGSASILLATRQWSDNERDASIETLRNFLEKHPDHPGRPTAQASLGYKLVAQGKAPEAAPIFEELVQLPSARFLAPYALISLGDIAANADDNDRAESLYQRARNEFPTSAFAETASRRLASLRAAAPVEIDPPPADAEVGDDGAVPPVLTPFEIPKQNLTPFEDSSLEIEEDNIDSPETNDPSDP